MNISIPTQDDDDLQFIKIVNQVLTQLLKQNTPEEAFVIRIDRWFDHKWLNFSGIGLIHFDNAFITNIADVSLNALHQEKITFPPFNPNRVLEEYHFFRVGEKEYFESVPDKLSIVLNQSTAALIYINESQTLLSPVFLSGSTLKLEPLAKEV